MRGTGEQSMYRFREVPGLPKLRRAQGFWSMVSANTF